MMKVIVSKDSIEGGTKAFEIIKEGMENGANVLGLATGSSPISLYSDMCNSKLDFSEMTRDLENNMDLSRIPHPTEKDFTRLERYRAEYQNLAEVLKS